MTEATKNSKNLTISTFSPAGIKSTSKINIPKDFVIERKNKDQLIKEAYIYNQSYNRINLAKTKTRGQVRGGGKKPWRQKGTGRARFGSSRNPIWRGGGIVFGPSSKENYATKLNHKSRLLALKLALLSEIQESNVTSIENFKIKTPNTAKFNDLLNKIGLKRSVLIVIDELNENLELSIRNLNGVKSLKYSILNVKDILDYDHLLFTSSALNKTVDWLQEKDKKKVVK